MSIKNLLDPIIEQGIRNTNFFEGRLLSGEDLRNQYHANKLHDRYLGQAIGQGIMHGLEVELDDAHDGSDGKPPVLSVKKGMAINASGEAIGLPDDDIKLALSRSIEKPVLELADFYACVGPPGLEHIPNGVGLYILVMSPVAGFRERAPKSGLGDGGVARGCGSRYIQEGVQFSLQEITKDMLVGLEGNSAATKTQLENELLNKNSPLLKNEFSRMSVLRSLLAHINFATEKRQQLDYDMLVSSSSRTGMENYGFIDKMKATGLLSNCDVPLALLYWSLDGIGFVDMWSVRRMTYKETKNQVSPVSLNERRQQENYATYRQFQAHINHLIKTHPAPDSIKAKDYFSYIPAVAILPLSKAGAFKGIDRNVFFEDMESSGPIVAPLTRMQSMLQDSFSYLPIKVALNELIWIYQVQENQNGYINGVVPDQEYIFYSTGNMPFYGHAQFNLSRWGFSNYEPAIK